MAILISDKTDFKTKMLQDKEGFFNNAKRVNPSGRYNNYKHMDLTTKTQNAWAKVDKTEWRDTLFK